MLAWSLFEVFINMFQTFLCLYFFENRLRINKPHKHAFLLCFISYTLFLSSYMIVDIPFSDSLGCLVFFVYLTIVSDEHWFVCAFWVIVEEIIFISVIGFMLQLCLTTLSVPLGTLISPNKYRVIYILSTNLALFLIIFILSKIKLENSLLNWSALALFLGVNISVLVVIELLFSLQIQELHNNDWPFVIAYIVLILCSIFTIILYHLMTTLTKKEQEAQVLLNHTKLTSQYQRTLEDLYSNMLARQHDFKHQLQTIEYLIQTGGSEAAQDYFSSYKERQSKQEEILTGSIALDALLTSKALSCSHNNIDFQLTHCPLQDLPLSEIDLCSIVGNLIDNAIEGTNRIKDLQQRKWIHISFSRIWDMFYIKCENNIEPDTIQKRGPIFLSSKTKTSSIHGFGIRNIIFIVENADGIYHFDHSDCTFTATITLPYPP